MVCECLSVVRFLTWYGKCSRSPYHVALKHLRWRQGMICRWTRILVTSCTRPYSVASWKTACETWTFLLLWLMPLQGQYICDQAKDFPWKITQKHQCKQRLSDEDILSNKELNASNLEYSCPRESVLAQLKQHKSKRKDEFSLASFKGFLNSHVSMFSLASSPLSLHGRLSCARSGGIFFQFRRIPLQI